MISFNEGNILDIGNDYGSFNLEDDIRDGMSLIISNKKIALSMVALFTNNELKGFLQNTDFHVIKSSIFSQRNGSKKVLETIFTTKSFDEEKLNKKDFQIILTSEDTRYTYKLSEEEWVEMIKLMTWVTNGYKK